MRKRILFVSSAPSTGTGEVRPKPASAFDNRKWRFELDRGCVAAEGPAPLGAAGSRREPRAAAPVKFDEGRQSAADPPFPADGGSMRTPRPDRPRRVKASRLNRPRELDPSAPPIHVAGPTRAAFGAQTVRVAEPERAADVTGRTLARPGPFLVDLHVG